MKIDEKPLKTEYYIGYYDKEKCINNQLIEEYFITESVTKFRIKLIEIIQNPKYIYTEDTYKVVYFEKYVEKYQLYCLEEANRNVESIDKFEEWKKANNIRSGKKYVYQSEMDL